MPAILLSCMNLFQGQASVCLKEVGKDTCLFHHLENTTEPALAPLSLSPPPEGYGDKHSTSYLCPHLACSSVECAGPASLMRKYRLAVSTHG